MNEKFIDKLEHNMILIKGVGQIRLREDAELLWSDGSAQLLETVDS